MCFFVTQCTNVTHGPFFIEPVYMFPWPEKLYTKPPCSLQTKITHFWTLMMITLRPDRSFYLFIIGFCRGGWIFLLLSSVKIVINWLVIANTPWHGSNCLLDITVISHESVPITVPWQTRFHIDIFITSPHVMGIGGFKRVTAGFAAGVKSTWKAVIIIIIFFVILACN